MAITLDIAPDQPFSASSQAPPLSSGDRLVRAEFERRYAAHPEITRAELVEGVVYVASPTHAQAHSIPHFHLIGWLATYLAATPGVRGADNVTLCLDDDNVLQPDICAWIEHSTQPRAWVDKDDFLHGAPELIIEIAATSATYDLYDKLQAYRRNRVSEYLVVVTYERMARWHRWIDGRYVVVETESDGIYRSAALPGLWLAVDRFWAGDLPGLLATAQQGIHSPEHAQFIADLQTK
ncbi:MAG TPA: Uma2 family endonuclease [Chloroflexi bacterium]|nr:Uma2 family endonuclease [Chloroflexota bacterium]